MYSIYICLHDKQVQASLAKKIKESLGNLFPSNSIEGTERTTGTPVVNESPLLDLVEEVKEGYGLANTIKNHSQSQSNILIIDEISFQRHASLKRLNLPMTVVLYTSKTLEEMIHWFQQLPLKNLLIQTNSDRPDFSVLMISLHKIMFQKIFGIERYTNGGGKIIKKQLHSSEERHALKEEISSFLSVDDINVKIKRAALSVLEELTMNGFYNAPVDEQSQPLFSQRDQTIPVRLPEDKAIEIGYIIENGVFILSVCDPYGSFEDSFLINSLSRHFNGSLTLKDGKGGAGYGLVKLYKSLSHLIVNIEPGRRTEFIAILNIGVRYNQFLKAPRSLNIFLK